jgi:hypothetical protein
MPDIESLDELIEDLEKPKRREKRNLGWGGGGKCGGGG